MTAGAAIATTGNQCSEVILAVFVRLNGSNPTQRTKTRSKSTQQPRNPGQRSGSWVTLTPLRWPRQ
ncbi:hypothetical protein AMR42_09645 [Limnothrix sp. PR1529]|nr:hypothetical protein BCR12_05510 [Limnothrix sp. P13C2]PIB11644.1 hypothetical protein AMR42_09645 [Limnothrix sp. PR1529]